MSIVTITSNFKVSTDYIDAVIINSGNNDPDLIFMNTVESANLDNVTFSATWQIYGNLRINPARIASVKQTTEGYVISTMNNHSFTVPAITGTIADVIADSALGGSGGSVAPFVVGEWDMTGSLATAVPIYSQGGTVGGTAPNFELTPTDQVVLVESYLGVPTTGTGQVFAKAIVPDVVPGDTIFALGFLLANSATSIGTLTAGQWYNQTYIIPDMGYVSESISIINGVMQDAITGPTFSAGDTIYFGYDYDTGYCIIQKNSEPVVQMAQFDVSGMPVDQMLKVALIAQFMASPVLADAPIVFSLGTTDGGKTPFSVMGDATLPVGAADGLVYEAINSGSFGGVAVTTGDFVQLYDTTTKIIVTKNTLDIASTEATVGYHGSRLDALEALVQQLTPGTYAFGTTDAASLKQLVLTADNQSFTLSAASGTVVNFLVETVYGGYTPNIGDTFTLNGTKFNVIASYGTRFEVFHDMDNSQYNIRIINPADTNGANTITLVDAVTTNDVVQCHGNYISLDNGSLTEDLATWSLTGTQADELVKLHDVLVFDMDTYSAFGITAIGGNTFGLAPGEKCLRFRGGIWVKV